MRIISSLLLVLPLLATPAGAQNEHDQTQRVQAGEEVEALRWLLARAFQTERRPGTDEIRIQIVRSDDDHAATLAAAAEGNPLVEVVEPAHTRPWCPGVAPVQRGYRVSLHAVERPAADQVYFELRTECAPPPETPLRDLRGQVVRTPKYGTPDAFRMVERRELKWVVKKVGPGAYETIDFARRW